MWPRQKMKNAYPNTSSGGGDRRIIITPRYHPQPQPSSEPRMPPQPAHHRIGKNVHVVHNNNPSMIGARLGAGPKMQRQRALYFQRSDVLRFDEPPINRFQFVPRA